MNKTLTAEQVEAAKEARFYWHPIRKCLVVRHSSGAWVAVDEMLAHFAALLATQQPEPGADVTDTERLDWLIAQQAWIQWTVRDGSIRQCQVYDQDEDENHHVLSGEDRYFNTPREAIDAARTGESQ
ncbi:hypothetical protein MK974_24395 [Burkholderia ambifaria]|uniref:hypothetical protein n=1 Tax=Burkholderia ambifaria TaxID=152480 RepID=UPI0022A8EC98|nr:hypothetical protein [Burkholderia ambifaria]WAS56243.1 hypothetical protein MK974_24395 [Burkholderia ambifaria]